MLCLYDFFQGKDGDQQEAMLRELLKSLSCESDHCRLVSVITRTLEARDAVQHIIKTNFDGHILPCSPLDNMVSAILDYKSRITDRSKLEFAQWCDLTRILTLKPDPHSMTRGISLLSCGPESITAPGRKRHRDHVHTDSMSLNPFWLALRGLESCIPSLDPRHS